MKNHVLIEDIAHRAGAAQDDIRSLASEALWRGMMKPDENGQLWVPAHREHFLYGALGSEADTRKDRRVQAADEALLGSYADLNRMSRRPASSSSIPGAARRQQLMLASALHVLDALVELVDVKIDARRIAPEAADELKAEAAEVRRDAQHNAARALAAIRSLLDIAA